MTGKKQTYGEEKDSKQKKGQEPTEKYRFRTSDPNTSSDVAGHATQKNQVITQAELEAAGQG